MSHKGELAALGFTRGNRFMNDLATYEIFWHFLYLAVFHGVTLTSERAFFFILRCGKKIAHSISAGQV